MSYSVGEGTILEIGVEIRQYEEGEHPVIGKDCHIKSGCRIYPHTKIGDRTRISHNVIIEENCEIGDDCFIGHGTVLRPNTKIGNNVIIGHLTVFEGNCSVGDNSLIHSQCHITSGVTIEEDVFIAPFFVGANDKRMSHRRRHVIPFIEEGYTIKKGARIAIGVNVAPDITIGKNGLVGIGAVITKDVPENAIVYGIPATVKGEVPEEERL